ncbi:MAG: CBS domain-containing protein [Blastocatellia bacterium]|jgi:CBS domain-containing protein
MKVREVMSTPVVVVQEEATLEEVARTMLDHHIGCAPVVNRKGLLVGVITESDFAAKEKGFPFSTFRAPQLLGQWISSDNVERIYEAARQLQAKEIMQPQVITVTEDQTMNDAVVLMFEHDINRIPVIRDGVPVGIVSRHDLLRLLIQ